MAAAAASATATASMYFDTIDPFLCIGLGDGRRLIAGAHSGWSLALSKAVLN
jgi:hypothetical protein